MVNPGSPAPQPSCRTRSSALRRPLPNRRREAGLRPTDDTFNNSRAARGKVLLAGRCGAGDRWTKPLEQCEVDEGHSDLEAVGHTRPISIPKQLIAHIPA